MNKKCLKTLSGNHIWINNIWDIQTGETSGDLRYTNPYKYNTCLACGVINDLYEKESNT